MCELTKQSRLKKKLLLSISLFSVLVSGCNKALNNVLSDDTKLFLEINEKCAKLETTYFLDYLSSIDYSNLDDTYYKLVCAMRDYNIAVDSLYRGAPLQAIRNLNKMNDAYNADVVAKYIRIDTKQSITNLEYTLILKNDYNKNNRLYFGRLNNSTPIPFQLIDKIGDDYLILQDNVFDLDLKSDEVYKDGKCILKNNKYIQKSFELEKDMIKDIFILSEEDYKKYKKVKKGVSKYLDVKLDEESSMLDDKAASVDCEREETSTTRIKMTYWVKDEDNDIVNKVYNRNRFVDVNTNEHYSVRLAILVKGGQYEK